MDMTDFTKENTNIDDALVDHVSDVVRGYFAQMRGNLLIDIHQRIKEQVEIAIYRTAMEHAKGNQSRAAILLGISRGTISLKLKQYFGTTEIGVPKQESQEA